MGQCVGLMAEGKEKTKDCQQADEGQDQDEVEDNGGGRRIECSNQSSRFNAQCVSTAHVLTFRPAVSVQCTKQWSVGLVLDSRGRNEDKVEGNGWCCTKAKELRG